MAKGKGGRPKIPMITEDLGKLEGKLPPKPIELDQVIYWMDLGATAEEIAGASRVSVDTLDRRLRETTDLSFAELKEKCCGAAKIKLRQNQFKLSESNASMGIWLGKQWLGQKDNQEVNHTGGVTYSIVNFGRKESPERWKDEEQGGG